MAASPFKPSSRRDEYAGNSLVSHLIAMQRYKKNTVKSEEWIANMKFLWIRPQSKELTLQDSPKSWNYVAVSYPCKPMPEFDQDEGRDWRIFPAPTGLSDSRPNTVRNSVLDRASKYAKLVDSPCIWIDQECVEQRIPRKKQEAMDSMDLVYARSKYSVGLLSVILDKRHQIRALRALLDGECFRDEESPSSMGHDRGSQIERHILDLLERLVKDVWWQRAWIFQEEYLSFVKMDLLIRHVPDLEEVKKREFRQHRSRSIAGEICFRVEDLRHEATRFLSRMQDFKIGRQLLNRRRQTSKKLLRSFGKYNVLCEDDPTAQGKAMSARIFADIEQRDITDVWDRIPIVANTCSYDIRFDTRLMASKPYDIGLWYLMLSVSNGEIIDNEEANRESLPWPPSAEYLNRIAFSKFDPPVTGGQLSWLKRCRLSDVSLSTAGMHTKGYLWQVYYVFDPTKYRFRSSCDYSEQADVGLTDFERDYLLQFANLLSDSRRQEPRQRACMNLLAGHLENYVSEEIDAEELYHQNPSGQSAAKDHMDLMAKRLVDAIYNGEYIALANLTDDAFGQAAFIIPKGNFVEWVFTDWNYDRRTGREKCVYLQVEEVNLDQRPPRMRITDWINGLAFFRRRSRGDAVVRWPQSWTQPVPSSASSHLKRPFELLREENDVRNGRASKCGRMRRD